RLSLPVVDAGAVQYQHRGALAVLHVVNGDITDPTLHWANVLKSTRRRMCVAAFMQSAHSWRRETRGGCGIRTREGVNPTRFPSLPSAVQLVSRAHREAATTRMATDRERC